MYDSIRNNSGVAIAALLSDRCSDTLITTDVLRYAVRNDGANRLSSGLFGRSSIA